MPGEELTGHLGDMEYEYWKLVCDFSRIVLQDMGLEEKWGNKESYDIASEEKQLEEYFRWLYENAPEEYEKLMLYIVLREKGMDERNAEFCLSHLEELPQALEMIWEDGEKSRLCLGKVFVGEVWNTLFYCGDINDVLVVWVL